MPIEDPQAFAQTLIESITTLATEWGLQLLGAIAVFVIGLWLSRRIQKLVRRGLQSTDIERSLQTFIGNLAYYAVLAFTIAAALGILGIEAAAIAAVLGTAGLAIGLALQGSLSNIASGFLILLFDLFEVGDIVEISGQFGEVEEIRIFYTTLVTPDNKTITIPNREITDGAMINWSEKGMLRLELVYGIGYGDDLLKAKQVLEEIVTSHEMVMETPAPKIAVLSLGDNAVNLVARPYVRPKNRVAVSLDLTEQVKLRFDDEGIEFPYPQRDVHLFQNS